MTVTNYISMDGMLMGEMTSGVMRNYGTDALGSVVETVLNGVEENTYQYKPYGGLLAKTGVATDPSYLWNGGTGYRGSIASLPIYVRARHYDTFSARWLTKDLYWPYERVYAYCDNDPLNSIDFSGNAACKSYTRAKISISSKYWSHKKGRYFQCKDICLDTGYNVKDKNPCNNCPTSGYRRYCSGTDKLEMDYTQTQGSSLSVWNENVECSKSTSSTCPLDFDIYSILSLVYPVAGLVNPTKAYLDQCQSGFTKTASSPFWLLQCTDATTGNSVTSYEFQMVGNYSLEFVKCLNWDTSDPSVHFTNDWSKTHIC